MSNFQTRFDEAATEARRVVVDNGPDIRTIIPNFYGSDFDRITKAISRLLEKIDKGNVDHPEYLAHSTGNIAEYAVGIIQGVPNSMESGGFSHFVQTTLPSLLVCEERLLKAVGNYYLKVRDIKERYVKEIQKLAEESIDFREEARKAKLAAEEVTGQAEGIRTQIADEQVKSNESVSRIRELRDLAEKLASGDGRGKSLEAFKRIAESKVDAIEEILKTGQTSVSTAQVAIKKLEESLSRFSESQTNIDDLRAQALDVLSLSNQAGLARSYLNESKKLEIRSYIFTGILYATSIAAAVIAAFYIIPSLEHSFSNEIGHVTDKAVPIAILRATILAPLVYVIYFTTKQISSIETLRMDYAEKAAASLAYSGYKGEMSEDVSLLEKLRGSLLLKFAEHPERLLRKRPVTDKIEVETPGFRASSSSAEAKAPHEAAE